MFFEHDSLIKPDLKCLKETTSTETFWLHHPSWFYYIGVEHEPNEPKTCWLGQSNWLNVQICYQIAEIRPGRSPTKSVPSSIPCNYDTKATSSANLPDIWRLFEYRWRRRIIRLPPLYRRRTFGPCPLSLQPSTEDKELHSKDCAQPIQIGIASYLQ